MAHEVNVDQAQIDRAFQTFEALPPPGAEHAPEPDPADAWRSTADLVSHGLVAGAPNWQIDQARRADFADALARFLGDVAPAGPGDPKEWPAWLNLAFAGGAIVVCDGIDWQNMRVKPLRAPALDEPEPGQGEDPEPGEDPAPTTGGFTTL